jgi:hypothetical protein
MRVKINLPNNIQWHNKIGKVLEFTNAQYRVEISQYIAVWVEIKNCIEIKSLYLIKGEKAD